jgi:hypothetical protein
MWKRRYAPAARLQDANQFCLVLRQQVYQVHRGLGHLKPDFLASLQRQDGARFLQVFDKLNSGQCHNHPST